MTIICATCKNVSNFYCPDCDREPWEISNARPAEESIARTERAIEHYKKQLAGSLTDRERAYFERKLDRARRRFVRAHGLLVALEYAEPVAA